MLKTILIIVLILLISCIGYGFSYYYIQRKKFFDSLVFFIQNMKNDINFSQDKLIEIIDRNLNVVTNKDLNTLLCNYKNLIISNIDKRKLFCNINFLKENEKEIIFIFFKGLGKTDVFNQIELLDKFSNKLTEFYSNATHESKKYSSLYLKLGILFGLFVAIILI